MIVCHQNDVCKYSVGRVYGGLRECEFRVFRKLWPVGFLVVSKCS